MNLSSLPVFPTGSHVRLGARDRQPGGGPAANAAEVIRAGPTGIFNSAREGNTEEEREKGEEGSRMTVGTFSVHIPSTPHGFLV